MRRRSGSARHDLRDLHGPPESHIRILTQGLAEGGPASVIVHRHDLAERIGGWNDYREIADPPDADLCRRAHAGGRVARVQALTVFKFNSAWRRNSYRERPSHEQAAMRQRLARERDLFSLLECCASSAPRPGAVADLPRVRAAAGPEHPGWVVEQWRRYRGL